MKISRLDRGELFGQKAKAIGIARGEMDAAMAYAQGQGWDVDRLFAETKASVGSFGTTDYALHTPSAFDFAEFLRPQTILGRLSGLRHVPSHTRLIAQTAGSTAWWVGERQVRPISKSQYTGLTLRPLGNTAITVVTSELVRSSDPKAEPILTRDLARSQQHSIDNAFTDPANGGEANVKPASVFIGATARVSSGSALANIDADLDYIINALVLAGSDLQWAHFIMLPRTALYLARLRGSGGDLAYPGLSVKGGNLFGIPVVVSAAIPGAGSPSASIIGLVDAGQILVADDNGGTVEVGRQAALQMVDDMQSPEANTLVSMFQTDSVAYKTTRFINWEKCRTGMAQYISGVTY